VKNLIPAAAVATATAFATACRRPRWQAVRVITPMLSGDIDLQARKTHARGRSDGRAGVQPPPLPLSAAAARAAERRDGD